MTQAIINNLNIQNASIEKYVTSHDAIKPIEKVKNDTPYNSGILSIFEEIKNKFCSDNEAKTVNIEELKDTIKEVTEEANIENALDLTLARDVNEIISQLRLAIEMPVEDVEPEVTDIIDAADNEVAQEELNIPETTDVENNDINQNTSKISNFIEQAVVTKLDETDFLNDKADIDSKYNNSIADAELLFEKDTITEDIIKTTSKAITDEAARAIEEASSETGDLGLDEDALKELNIESLEAESGAYGETGSQLQEQSTNEHVVKVMLNQDSAEFEVKAPSQNVNQATKAEPTTISTNKIIEQITKQLEGLHHGSKLNIVLNPESLGKVSIQITKSAEGMSAQFTVASQEAREVLMKGIDGLKDGLLSHGVNIDNVSVKMNETQKSEYNQDWTEQENSNGGNKGQKQQNKEEKEKGLFEQVFAQADLEKDGNV